MIGRIQDRHGFELLRRDGARIRIDPLWCSYLHQPGLQPVRVAFAIGRATGNAVTRNRLRRRLRSILGTPPTSSAIPDGLLLIGAKPAATELTFAELRQLVERLVVEMNRRATA